MLTAFSNFVAAWMQDATFDAGGGDGGLSFFMMLVQTIFALGLVCGLAYVVFRWVLPRLNAVRPSGGMIRVVERVGLDARKSLYVVEVAGRWLFVASSEAGVQVLSELDATTAEEAAREAERLRPTFGSDAAALRGAFADRLGRVINRKGGGQ
ncbi:MAG TPA: flagellar biosynthetic protein FliO [Pyrinomonadaceae bacterium]|nr:flagellar biosynthetic protein FliO [Pyrinomonadaceae bacterium]